MFPDATGSPPEASASNSSFLVGLSNVNNELTNLRGTVRPDFDTDRPNRDYTIGGSMDNFRRQFCTISKSTYVIQQNPTFCGNNFPTDEKEHNRG